MQKQVVFNKQRKILSDRKYLKRELTFEDKQVRSWLILNRGVLIRTAQKCGVTPQMVRLVAYGLSGESGDEPVKRELQMMGWPGVGRK